jgi:hypothetical protein
VSRGSGRTALDCAFPEGDFTPPCFTSEPSRALRKRLLFTGLTEKGGAMRGLYIGVSSSSARYMGAVSPGYSKAFAREGITNIRTDLDAFNEVERGVLESHGYALMDAAVRTHLPDLLGADTPFTLPYRQFAPSAEAETELRVKLRGSESRKLTGRR